MSIELVSGKSTEELDALIKAAEAEKAEAAKRDVEELNLLVDKVKGMAEALGLKAKALFSDKKEYPPKYKDPNSEATWNGRGPQPAWFKALLENVPKDAQKEARKAYLIA